MGLEEKYRRMIQEALEEGRELPEGIPSVVRSSRQFRKYHRQMQAILDSFQRVAEIEPPEGLKASIMTRLNAEGLMVPQRVKARLLKRASFWVMVAGVLLSSWCIFKLFTMGAESFWGRVVLSVVGFFKDLSLLSKLWGYISIVGSGLWTVLLRVASARIDAYGIGLFVAFALLFYIVLVIFFPRWRSKPVVVNG